MVFIVNWSLKTHRVGSQRVPYWVPYRVPYGVPYHCFRVRKLHWVNTRDSLWSHKDPLGYLGLLRVPQGSFGFLVPRDSLSYLKMPLGSSALQGHE